MKGRKARLLYISHLNTSATVHIKEMEHALLKMISSHQKLFLFLPEKQDPSIKNYDNREVITLTSVSCFNK